MTIQCAACGTHDVVEEPVTCVARKLEGRTFDFVICKICGFIANPTNLHNYLDAGFGATSRPETSTRAGDGVTPRREYRIAEMGVDILGRLGGEHAADVLVFGSGLSYDHVLMKQRLPVGRVALSDMANFQEVDDFVPLSARDQQFDLVIASEVVEHFTSLDEDFENLFSKVKPGGLVVASTNIHDGTPLQRLLYPFLTGHTAYYTGRALQAICRRFDLRVDFRTPAAALGEPGPRKRYLLFFRDPAVGECISQYFADHHLAPSE